MEQKEHVRDVDTQAANQHQVDKIINRLARGRRDLGGVREVLAKHTPDEIVEMFERPAQDNDCFHCKGGKLRSPHVDYAIRVHTFADGHRTVKCTICGKEWAANHPTAIHMMNRTTNTPSSSEVAIEVVEKQRETKLKIQNRLLRHADAFYRLQEAEEILTLLNHGSRLSTSEKLYVRIREYREELKKVGRGECF